MDKKELLDTLRAILADIHVAHTCNDYHDEDYYHKKVFAMSEAIDFIEDNYID